MDEPKKCASCDIELDSLPVVVRGFTYCCHGCAVGGPCVCSYVGNAAKYPRNGHIDKVMFDIYGEII